MGPGVSRAEFTIANAVKKAARGLSVRTDSSSSSSSGAAAGYITQHVGKWHLGDFWNKKNPAVTTGASLRYA